MARKLFIVDPGNERLYQSLRATLENEPDVEILYDRRHKNRPTRWHGVERRTTPDMQDRIRTEGFVVIRPAAPTTWSGNIRWTA